MTHSFLDRGTGRIAYETHGAGPLVLALPGMGDLRSTYRHLIPGLVTAGFRVAVLDLRGHGDSDLTFDAFDDEALASDAMALIEQLGGPAVLVGNSMGAGAAVIAAAARPDLVVGLALLAPFVRDPAGSGAVGLLLRAALLRPWGPRVWAAYHRGLFPGALPADFAAERAAITASLARPGRWRAFQRTARTTHAPAERVLRQVHVPAVVVVGGKDRDWKDPAAEGRFVADALAAELLVLPDSGHFPQADAPDAVLAPLIRLAERAQHA